MVLGRTLGIKYSTSGIASGMQLASGMAVDDIEQLNKRAKKLMATAGKIPVNASPEDILKTAQLAKFMKDQKDLITQQLEKQGEQLDAIVATRDAAIRFTAKKMNAEQKFQEQGATLQELQLKHRLATGITQSESIGTQMAYSASKKSRWSDL